MATRKKKEKKAIGAGLAVAGLGIALMSGMSAGGGSQTGKPVTAWLHNRNAGTLIVMSRTFSGDSTTTVGNTIISSDREEYRMTTFRTDTPYYVYGQEETARISSIEIGTDDDISSDGEVHPNNTDTFYVVVNGSLVGLKASLAATTLNNATFTLIATIEFQEATA